MYFSYAPYNVDEDSVRLLRLSDEYPEIRPCLGIHPWNVHNENIDEVENLIESSHKRIVGIGEIGLDFAQSILERNPVFFVVILYE